jgi:protein-tyrosine phosphatase
MWTELHWVNGPWLGRLAVAARPRGDDWLDEELLRWRGAGLDSVLSLLTSEEEHDLGLDGEALKVRAAGMNFLSFPILDREVPTSDVALNKQIEELNRELIAGRNVALHCRQGVGRTGLVAACLLVSTGWDPESAVRALSTARGIAIPETKEQRRWIDRYAASMSVIR